MKYKHYAPNAKITIVKGQQDKVIEAVNRMAVESSRSGHNVAVMASSETAPLYIAGQVIDMGSRNDEAETARKLFAVLRQFDESGVDVVYSESFPTDDVGQAVMNRLIKAAGHTVIEVS